ncbi:MAG: AAA family ATPase [Gammaproteobacteria bacterium]|nr:AAA family ATPase [Gammaproteobacteria bacterium]
MHTINTGSDHQPFDPKESKRFYPNAAFEAACADVLGGIRGRQGIILLTGEAGVGKTLVLRRCMAEANDIRFVLLTNASLDFPDILNYLCANLELPTDHLDAGQQSRLLLDALAACARRNQIVALMIDDAHHLRLGVLRRLYDFLEMPAIPTQRLQVVLAGLPDIEGKLRQPELHRLQNSIATRCRLSGLGDQDAKALIRHQFETADHWDGGLPPDTVTERIARYCQGIPRAIVMLCDTLLLFAGLEAKAEITPVLVDEAARSCFLNEPSQQPSVSNTDALPYTADTIPPLIADKGEPELDFPELGLVFDFDLEETLKSDANSPAEPALDAMLPDILPVDEISPPTQLVIDETPVEPSLPPASPSSTGKPIESVAEPRKSTAASRSLREFAHLLSDLGMKQDRKEGQNYEALRYFRNVYLRWLHSNDPAQLDECERRFAQLQETRQPVLIGLATAAPILPERDGVLCALLINPTWWLYREIRLHVRSPDLIFAQDGQAPPVRLLDGRDAHPVYLDYRLLHTESARTTLWLELELCDHRGEWFAYTNRLEIRLDFSPSVPDNSKTAVEVGVEPHYDRFWPDLPVAGSDPGGWLAGATRNGSLACTLLLELEDNPEHTQHLRAANEQTLSRGTPLTRALLLAVDPAQAPARIELVSRPLMIFGRQSATAGSGFGDFNLGFVPKYSRISRLHCVICALGDQLALMAASDHGHTYTGHNGQRLDRGRWEILAANDVVDICDLYHLRLSVAWDRKGEREVLDWDPQEPRNRFGHYLLELVDILRQRDQHADDNELRANLRNRYLHLTRMQDRVAEMNGIGNTGALLYIRFERDDAAHQQIAHYYVPKWLPIGSSPQDGLRINAPDVAPHHAELLFRDGMYWIQNLAASGSVQVGCHGLATNEVLVLETGDSLTIGSARFTFEGY